MNLRIKFPAEAMDFIESLEGFEIYASYYSRGPNINPCEWGRIRQDDKTIYFDCVREKKPTKKQFVNVKIEIETPSDCSIKENQNELD